MSLLFAIVFLAAARSPGWHRVSAKAVAVTIAVPPAFHPYASKPSDFWVDCTNGMPCRWVLIRYSTTEPHGLRPHLGDLIVAALHANDELIEGWKFHVEVARISETLANFHNGANVQAWIRANDGGWIYIDTESPAWADQAELVKIVESMRPEPIPAR